MATLVLFCWGVYKFMKSKTLKKMALNSVIDGQVPSARHQVNIGDKGVTITRLAEYGQADFDGKILEVRSIDGFIDPKTPVEVKRISGDTVMVAKQKID
ncbi:MAG TPA: NfeD family protein [Bacteroidaceae bacterium]|nr:NfeD family protein [Bacteroidaceae bacterium]